MLDQQTRLPISLLTMPSWTQRRTQNPIPRVGQRHERSKTQIVAIATATSQNKPETATYLVSVAVSISATNGHLINGDQRRPEADKYNRSWELLVSRPGTAERNDVWPWGRARVAGKCILSFYTYTLLTNVVWQGVYLLQKAVLES